MRRLTRRGMMVAVAVAVVAVAAVAVVLASSGSRTGVDRVKELVKWPSDCEDVHVRHDDRALSVPRWPHAVAYDVVECEHLGPNVTYARFKGEEALRHDVAAKQPGAWWCQARTEVVVSGLTSRAAFADFCRAFHGTLHR